MRFKIPEGVDYLATNHENWDQLGELHYTDPDDWYGVQRFLDGGDARCPIDIEEMGDLSGKRVLHSQCHFGLDTLSVARTAQSAVGLDFSENAVKNATALAARAGLSDKATFVHANVYDAGQHLEAESFDMIYCSWGVTPWLPDLQGWATTLCKLLKPGGQFYYAEGHPFAWTLDEKDGDHDGPLINTMGYWIDEALVEEWAESYTGITIPKGARKAVEFAHTMEDFFTVFLNEGMKLEFFHEHENIPWPMYTRMANNRDENLLYHMPKGKPRMPMGFSFMWTKPN